MTISSSTTEIKYDPETGYLYSDLSGTWAIMTGYSWNGSSFILGTTTLEK